MRSILLTILLLITFIPVQSQDEGIAAPNTELCVQMFDNFNNATITFEMELESPENYFIQVYNLQVCEFLQFTGSYPRIETLTGVSSFDPFKGFEYTSNIARYNAMQSGLFRVSVKENGVERAFFYYDNRHSAFPSNNCNPNTGNDITVRYNVATNLLTYQTSIQRPGGNLSGTLINGTLLSWANVFEVPLNFATYTQRLFPVLSTPQSVGSSPYLSWQAPNVSQQVLYYEVQRAWYPYGFQTIATTTQTNFHDLDIFYVLGHPNMNQHIMYRIISVFNSSSDISNIQELTVDRSLLKKNSGGKNIETPIAFNLEQNYPNPFNPTTKIVYDLPENSFVSLIVYNTLGEVVSILENKFKAAGRYEAEFNGKDLPSGLYIYSLRANGKVLNNKMLLAK